MSIIRVKKDARYFSASNEPFNDKRLSWESRGLIGYLLSKPNNWQINMTNLEKAGPAGNFKLRRMLAELRKCGYMNRIRVTLEHGKFDWISEVYESPSQNPNPSKVIIKTTSGGLSTSGSPTGGKLPDIVSTDKVSTDELKKIGADAPGGLDWKLGHGQEVSAHDFELQREAEYRNSADLIAMGTGINSMVAYDIALSFMQTRKIVIPEGKVKGQRKAVREMIQSGVSGQHVKLAVEKLVGEGMTIVDLFSVAKTAEDIANQPAKIASQRPEHQPVPPDPNEGKYVPNPFSRPKSLYPKTG